MPRKPLWPPPIYPSRGVDYLRLYVAPGEYKDYWLGPTGSAESRENYQRLVAELEANGRRPLPDVERGVLVAELAAAYLAHAKVRHEARQYARVQTALSPLTRLYGTLPAASLTPGRLEVVRRQYVEAGYCRRLCNQMTSIVRQMYYWAVVRDMVPTLTAQGLAMLEPLRKRQSAAPDHPKVPPAKEADVLATLPHLPPIVADMVRVQLLTGMRPGELCVLRPCDLRRDYALIDGVAVWLYVLDEHKTDWKGHARQIPVGTRAQTVLTPYLARDEKAYCFSPHEVRAAYARSRGQKMNFGRTRRPGTRYTTQSYGRCVAKACRRAGVPPWSPNRLRHAAGTRVEVEFGREDARVFLGHDNPSTTAIYAEGVERAARIAAKIG